LALLAYTLPTLLTPPFAERLALRTRPGLVIPAGLFTIGLGFLLMKLGSMAATPDWRTMLPGCAIAGIGLGCVNTPVTNTTTGSVSRDRAGMASGIDMSARMISLAINIAMMGFILVSGVRAYFDRAWPARPEGLDLSLAAERVAAGARTPDIPIEVARAALTQGFGWVMLYGGFGVCFLAVISFLVFNLRVARPARA
jgi:hypothetical protein